MILFDEQDLLLRPQAKPPAVSFGLLAGRTFGLSALLKKTDDVWSIEKPSFSYSPEVAAVVSDDFLRLEEFFQIQLKRLQSIQI